MKILISGFWDRNISSLGAQALSEGLLYIVKNKFPKDDVTPLQFPRLGRYFDKLMGYMVNSRNKIVYFVILSISYLIYLAINSKRCKQLKSADLLIVNGDGIVADIFWLDTLTLALDIKYAQEHKIKVVTLNQSVNTVPGSFADFLVRKFFLTNPIALREEGSYRYIQQVVRQENKDVKVLKSVDSAFLVPLLDENETEKFSKETSAIYQKYNLQPKNFCIVGVRGNRPKDQIINPQAWGKIISAMREITNKPIIFASTCPEYDIPLSHKIKEYVPELIIIEELYDWGRFNYRFFLHMLKDSFLCVSDRYHQNVFAALCQIPFVPIQGNTGKTKGLIELLEYPIDVLPLPDSHNTEEIISKIRDVTKQYNEIKKITDSLEAKLKMSNRYDEALDLAMQSKY